MELFVPKIFIEDTADLIDKNQWDVFYYRMYRELNSGAANKVIKLLTECDIDIDSARETVLLRAIEESLRTWTNLYKDVTFNFQGWCSSWLNNTLGYTLDEVEQIFNSNLNYFNDIVEVIEVNNELYIKKA